MKKGLPRSLPSYCLQGRKNGRTFASSIAKDTMKNNNNEKSNCRETDAVCNHLKHTKKIMKLFIKKYQNNNEKSNAFGKTYGRTVMLGTTELEELATEIQESCTATRADILAVLSALGPAIKRKLQSSMRVMIPYLGTFKLGVKTKGEVLEEDFDVRKNVLGVHVVFQPETKVENGHRVKELTRGVRLAELPKNLMALADSEDEDENTGNTGNTGDNNGGGDDTPVENRP